MTRHTNDSFMALPECPLDETGIVPIRAGLLTDDDYGVFITKDGRAWGTHMTLDGVQERFRRPNEDQL